MRQYLKAMYSCKVLSKLTLVSLLSMMAVLASMPVATLASPPTQRSTPTFDISVTAATDGSSSISSAEAVLAADYLAANGKLDGLELTEAGLTLAKGATSGTYTTDGIKSPLSATTDLLPYWKATISEGASIKVETRISSDNLNWSIWAESSDEFYPVRDDEHGGTMVWIGSKETIYAQIRLTLAAEGDGQITTAGYDRESVTLAAEGDGPSLQSFTLVFNDATQGPSDKLIAAQLPAEAATKVCPAERPTIISRTQWGSPDGQNSPYFVPQTTNITHIVVHHTATPSSLAEWNVLRPYAKITDWSAVVRAIWNHHTIFNRWGDIGYNYLVDPDGNIYEGRAGSQGGQVDIVGAHDGINKGSMGVAFIGCYGQGCTSLGLQSTQPPQVMMNKGVELMGWKVGQRGIDPKGQGPYGGKIQPTIIGARDVYSTLSPGSNIYNTWLPWLRDAVRDRVSCQPKPIEQCTIDSITFDKAAYNLNDTISFQVKLLDQHGNPFNGATVRASISINEVAASSTDSFDLLNTVGLYDGTYRQTGTKGAYTFAVTANHSSFASCSRSEVVNVGIDSTSPTATPTPTPTPNTTQPTPTPNTTRPTPIATPTPVPGGTRVDFAPSILTLPLNSPNQKTDIVARNMPDFKAFDITLRFDPNIVQVVDTDSGREGIQVQLGTQFRQNNNFIADNTVDNATGIIRFATTLLGSVVVNGDVTLIEVNWQPVREGQTAVTIENLDLVSANAQPIAVPQIDGTIEVVAQSAGFSGKVILQGRAYNSGAMVTDADGYTMQSSLDGTFYVTNSDHVTINAAGYLRAKLEVSGRLAQLGIASNANAADLGSVVLIAGDMNGDDQINIFDLAYMANSYETTDPVADLNADGIVNILDIALAANNYELTSASISWQ